MENSAKHIELLDRVRGVAILAVLLVHTLGFTFGYGELPWGSWFRQFSVPVSFLYFLPLSIGNVGVPIFFVVSGFCIHMSFQRQGQAWRSFFIRRFFRIYPAYLMALIFSTLLIYVSRYSLDFRNPQVWTQLLTHFFLVHNLNSSTFTGINGPFWSLAVETQLYLLYPVLLVLVAKLGWRRTMVVLAAGEVLIRGADGLIRGTDGVVQAVGGVDTPAGHVSWLLAASPLGHWFSWALGAFLADAVLKKQPLPFMKTSPALWLSLAVISYFVRPLNPFRFLLFAVVTAVAISKLLSGAGPTMRAPSFALDLLGKIGLWSYSIYLLHQPLLEDFSYVIDALVPGKYRSPAGAFSMLLLTWLAIIPFSVLWYKIFELPAIAFGKRIIQKRITGEARFVLEPSPGKARSPLLTTGHVLRLVILLVFVGASLLISARLNPLDPGESNNRAWLLATNPDAAKRDGPLAVKLAEDACNQTHFNETVMVGTLAAAYAEAGKFDAAILAAQKACELAAQKGETNLLQNNQELLRLYQHHQAYRDGSLNLQK